MHACIYACMVCVCARVCVCVCVCVVCVHTDIISADDCVSLDPQALFVAHQLLLALLSTSRVCVGGGGGGGGGGWGGGGAGQAPDKVWV